MANNKDSSNFENLTESLSKEVITLIRIHQFKTEGVQEKLDKLCGDYYLEVSGDSKTPGYLQLYLDTTEEPVEVSPKDYATFEKLKKDSKHYVHTLLNGPKCKELLLFVIHFGKDYLS
jgi:hypothetical protein